MQKNPPGSRSNPASRPASRYRQIADILRRTILNAPGEQPLRLPSQQELCKQHNVSEITIRKSMDLLASEGLVTRTVGRGTYSVPKAAAEHKQANRSNLLHLVASNSRLDLVKDGFYGQMYRAILEQTTRMDIRVALQVTQASRPKTSVDLHLPADEPALGVVFLSCMNEAMIRHATDAGYPTVCLDYWTTNPQADAVIVDCYSEGQAAVEYLLRQGHNRLCYVGHDFGQRGNHERESDAELFLAGLQRGLVQMGLPPMPAERILYVSTSAEEHFRAVEWFLSLRPCPTAGVVFASGTCHALRAGLMEKGILCPEHISLLTKATAGDETDITCFRGQPRQMGSAAVGLLMDRVRTGRDYGVRLAMATRLDRGRSVRQIQ